MAGWLQKAAKIDVFLPGGKASKVVDKAWQDMTGMTQQIQVAKDNAAAQQAAMAAEAQAALAAGNAQARAAADAQAQATARAAAERAAADAAAQPVASTEVIAGGQPVSGAASRRKKAQFGRGGSSASITI